MSIIIKGLNMPKASSEDCIAVIRSNGKVEVWQTGVKEFEAEAIQIPTPHGRLIDGEKLCYEFIDWQYAEAPDHLNTKEGRMVTDHERQYEIYLALGEAVIEIANAPTILEAEE